MIELVELYTLACIGLGSCAFAALVLVYILSGEDDDETI